MCARAAAPNFSSLHPLLLSKCQNLYSVKHSTPQHAPQHTADHVPPLYMQPPPPPCTPKRTEKHSCRDTYDPKTPTTTNQFNRSINHQPPPATPTTSQKAISPGGSLAAAATPAAPAPPPAWRRGRRRPRQPQTRGEESCRGWGPRARRRWCLWGVGVGGRKGGC